MMDLLCPILELCVVLPGLLLAYFPVRSYLKQPPGKLSAWLLPLILGLCICGGLLCWHFRVSTAPALALIAPAAVFLYVGYPFGNRERSRFRSARYLPV